MSAGFPPELNWLEMSWLKSDTLNQTLPSKEVSVLLGGFDVDIIGEL